MACVSQYAPLAGSQRKALRIPAVALFAPAMDMVTFSVAFLFCKATKMMCATSSRLTLEASMWLSPCERTTTLSLFLLFLLFALPLVLLLFVLLLLLPLFFVLLLLLSLFFSSSLLLSIPSQSVKFPGRTIVYDILLFDFVSSFATHASRIANSQSN